MAKRRLRKILIICGALFALILIAVLLADTAFVKRRLIAFADRKLQAELGLSITAGDSTLRPLRLAASLRDVRVAPIDEAEGPLRALTASEIFVDLAWSTLVTGDLRVQEIRIVRPRLEAALPGDEAPAPSFPSPPASPEPAAPDAATAPTVKPFSFVVKKLSLVDGALAVGESSQPVALSLDDIRIDLRLLPPGPDHRGALRSTGGRLALSGHPVEIRTLEADLVLDERRIEIERVLLTTLLSRVELKGRVEDYQSSPSLDLSLSASLAAEEASRLLPSLPPAHGTLAIDGSFKGTPDAATAAVEARADSLVIDGYPEAAFRLSAESDLGTVDLKELTLESFGARLQARGRVHPAGDGESRLDLSWSGLNLPLLAAFIPGFPPLDAVSHGKLTANWREHELASLQASGEASFRSAMQAPRIETEPRTSLPFDADLAFTASRDGLDITRADLRPAGSELSLAGRMHWDGGLQARFEASLPDLAAAIQAASALTGPIEGLRGFDGRARIEGTVEGTTASPVFRAELAADDLAWNGLTVSSLEAALTLDGPALEITRFKADAAAGTLEGRFALRPAAVNDKTPGAPSMPPSMLIDAAASTSGFDLAFLAPLLPDTPLSGRIAFEAEGRGPLKKPAFSLRLEGRDVATAEVRIPALLLTAESDGTLSRAELTAGLSAEAPAPLAIEAELPLSPPYPLKARLRTDRLIIDNYLVSRAIAAQTPSSSSGARPIDLPPIPLTAEGSFLVPLEDLANSNITLSFTGLDLAGLAALGGAALPPGIGAEADLEIRAAGDPTDPPALTVEGEIGRIAFSGDLPPLETEGPVRFALRDGVFELKDLRLAVGDSSLRVRGSIRDLTTPEPVIAARASLDLDASLIPPGLVNASVGGRLKLDVFADGPALGPVIRGEGGLASGFFQSRDYPLVLSDLSLRLDLRDRSILVTDGKGLANGGLLALSGRIDLGLGEAQGPGIGRAGFDAAVEGFRLNYPPGLITLSDGKVRLEGDGRTWLLTGDLRILQGSFREDVFPGAELLGFSTLPLLPETETPPEAADRFRLDITASTVEPIIVRNNMADFGLEANIRVTGTMAAPLLAGRARNVSVGEIVFGERRYTLETLRLEFLGQPVPDPQVDIVAHTRMLHRMEDLEIRLTLSGPASDLKFSLTSTPPRSSQDLSLLLLTGRSLDEVRGSALDTLRGQMILHFTSPLLSPVTRSLERFLHIDDISFSPLGIASEEDPGARLTFVKNLSEQLALTYSIDVSQTQRQSWLMDYSLSRRFAVRGYTKDDGSYGGSFRHVIPLWAERDEAARAREVLTGVEVEAEGEHGARLDRRRLEKAWKPLRVGRPFRVSDLGRAADNLNRLYRREGYADAAVTPVVRRGAGGEATQALAGTGRATGGEGREGGPPEVTVVFRIDPGEPAAFDFRGDRISGRLRKKVLAAWTGKLPAAANLAAAREVILNELMRKRYYRAEVEAEALPAPEAATIYAIHVAKNGRYAVRGFVVEGGEAVPEPVVRKAASDFLLAESRGLWNLVHTPRLALRSVKRAYEERGYTKAEVEVRRLDEDRAARAVDIVLGIEQGPRSVVGSVAFEGHSVVEERELRAALEVRAGRPFDPVRVAEDRTALLNMYRGLGHQDVEIEVAASLIEAEEEIKRGGDVGVALTYKIKEGPRHTISAIDVSGEGRTGERFIRRTSGLRPGRPLTSQGLAMGQKRLYDTRVFRSVNIGSGPERGEGEKEQATGLGDESWHDEEKRNRAALAANDGVEGSGNKASPAGAAEQVRERVSIEVREMPPVTLAYGLRYNSEEKIEGFGEIDLRSPFGEGLAGLLAFRRNARQSDLRFSVESNYLFGVRFNLLSTVYAKRDIRELFTADESGLTLQSRFELPSKFDLSALYRMNRIHVYDPAEMGTSPIEEKVFVSEIGGLLMRDTRDDLLDPKRGSFLSLAVTWSPEFLATRMPYVSAFGQYQNYHRFGPGLVWAAAARVGAADAFGRELVAAKRYFAGGGNSVRGFKQDGVGPVDPLLEVPAGGAAVVVINQELRFPIFGPASGVVFYDAGAVYATLRDVRLGDVRHGMGVGLRVQSPVGLVRVDYGLNPWPRAGEKRSVFYLSIGQAF